MFKKLLIMSALIIGVSATTATDANAWVVRRVAPVRRVLLPPYPVARRVVAGPVYRRPVVYRAPVVYGPSYHGVYVW